MRYAPHPPHRGFVALMSAVVIAAVLLILMVTTSTGSYFARYDALSNEYKRISLGLSESCTNAALLKIAQDYTYTPAPGGEAVTVGPDTCRITSVTYGPEDPVTHRKTATIQTSAQYPLVGGAWSNTKVTATVLNPAVSVLQPPATCALQATPSSVLSGQSVTVQWTSSGNATSFALVPDSTPTAVETTGSRTFVAAGTGQVTYTGTATAPGGSTQCSATVTVTAPPPTPSCADTVLMMDRTNSTSSYQAEMTAAGKALLDLYKNVTPTPQVGVGTYGSLYGNPSATPSYKKFAQIPNSLDIYNTYGISGLLTDSYGSDNVSPATTLTTAALVPNAEGNFKQWTKNGSTNAVTDVLSNDADTQYLSESTSGESHTFKVANAGVPAGATINAVTLSVVAAKTSAVADPSISLRVEKGTAAANIKDNTSITLTSTAYSPYTWQMTQNPFTSAAWTVAEVNAWTTRFGMVKTTTSGTAKVTQLSVVVSYTVPGVASPTGLYKTVTEIYAHGTSGGGSSNLSDGLRVGNLELNRIIPVNGSLGHRIDLKKVLIFVADGKPDYPDTSTARLLNEADVAKRGPDGVVGTSDDTEIFSLYFGGASEPQRDLMAQVASGAVPVAGHVAGSKNDTGALTTQSVIDAENADGDFFFLTPSAAAMAGVVRDIGKIVCPAAAPACSNKVDDDGDGAIDAADPSCHAGNVITGAYDPDDNDEWTPAPLPPPPAAPPTQPPVTIDAWDEIVRPRP